MSKPLKYTKDFLEKFIPICNSMSQLLREMGLKVTGGNFRNISQRIKQHNIDISHFKGQGWSKGQTQENNKSIKKQARNSQTPDYEVFKENSAYPPAKLYNRLIKLGWVAKCSIITCGIIKWNDKYIRLHVDHINGNHSDHRLENLRFLCPNCHQQTNTWGKIK